MLVSALAVVGESLSMIAGITTLMAIPVLVSWRRRARYHRATADALAGEAAAWLREQEEIR